MSAMRLRETDINRPNLRPTSGPEIDDQNRIPSSESGIDDGFLSPNDPRIEFDIDPARPSIPTPDVNIYQQKKTLAQGMMDLALISANANQLRYVLESKGIMSYYLANIFLIGLSLLLQIGVGVMLIWNSRFNVKQHEDMCRANRINNITVCSIFMITITNVFISVFAVSPDLPITNKNN